MRRRFRKEAKQRGGDGRGQRNRHQIRPRLGFYGVPTLPLSILELLQNRIREARSKLVPGGNKGVHVVVTNLRFLPDFPP